MTISGPKPKPDVAKLGSGGWEPLAEVSGTTPE